jgi:hypothetical protein
MPNTAITMVSGYYTSLALTNIASAHFPAAYNTLLSPSELGWEPVIFSAYYQSALFVDYINLAGSQHRMLTYMAVADGAVSFFTRGGSLLPRADRGRLALVAPDRSSLLVRSASRARNSSMW